MESLKAALQELSNFRPGTNLNSMSAGASYVNMTRPISLKTMIENIDKRGRCAELKCGAGTILYSSSTIMTVLNREPSCTESGYITAETANSFYGPLPSAPGKNFIQSFLAIDEAPIIHKPGKSRPPLVLGNR